MLAYRVRRDDTCTGSFVGMPRWGLGGLSCSFCRERWSALGILYPSVSLADHPRESEFRQPMTSRPRPERQFFERCRAVAPLFPPNALLLPGVEIGPLRARARGLFGDFAWPIFYHLLIRRAAALRLIEHRVRLPPLVEQPVRYGSGESPDLVDLDMEYLARLSPASVPPEAVKVCPICGKITYSMPERLIFDRASIPDHVDLFRGAWERTGLTALIFATERFVRAVQELGLTGVSFSEIEMQ